MSKFNVGDRVRIKTSGKTGVVRMVYESGYWNMSDDEYGIEFDDGSGTITIVERVIGRETGEPVCTCGLKFGRHGGKHSDYCDLYGRDE